MVVAAKTIHGRVWLDNYIDSYLKTTKQICFRPALASTISRIGKSLRPRRILRYKLAEIGSHKVLTEMDVINSDIALLLSRASMKRADMNLNFKNDTASVFGKTI